MKNKSNKTMKYSFYILIGFLTMNISAIGQFNDDDLNLVVETSYSSGIEIYLSSEDENAERISWDSPHLDNNILFLDYPIELRFNDIEIEFGSDSSGAEVLIIQLYFMFPDLLQQFPEDYINHYLAFVFDGEIFHSILVNEPLNISRLEIPIQAEYRTSGIYQLWSEEQNSGENANEYGDYNDNILPSGIYLAYSSDGFDGSASHKMKYSDLYMANEPLVKTEDFDSTYFQKTDAGQFVFKIKLRESDLKNINQLLSKNPEQNLVLFDVDYSSFLTLYNNDSFDQNGHIHHIMNKNDAFSFSPFYQLKYPFEEDDLNLQVIKQFYEDINDTEIGFYGPYKKSDYKPSEHSILSSGEYQFVIYSVSKDKKKQQKDTLIAEILNKDWIISKSNDIFRENRYELSNNEFITYEDDSGNLYLNFTGLGLINFKKQGDFLIATSTNDTWEYTMEIRISKKIHESIASTIVGTWKLKEISINNELQDLPMLFEFQFKSDGTLISNKDDKKGIWMLSPSNKFLVMIEKGGKNIKDIFEIQEVSKQELVLKAISSYTSALMKLKKISR